MSNANAEDDAQKLARLETEKAVSAAAAEVAANWAKELKELLPSNVEALKGETTISGDHPVESQILTYRSLEKVAANIVRRIQASSPPKTVVIHNEQEISMLLGLRAFEVQLDLIEASLRSEAESARRVLASRADRAAEKSKTITESAAGLTFAPLAINTALRSAAELVSLFRMDIAVNYKTLTVADSALIAAIASELAAKQVSVYQSAVVPRGLSGSISDLNGRITKLIEDRSEIDDLQICIANRLAELKVGAQKLADTPAGGEADPSKKSTETQRARQQVALESIEALTLLASRLQLASASFDAFQSALLKTEGNVGANALVGLIRAERLRELKDAHWLVVKVAVAVGGHKTRRFLWWPTTKILYSGGIVAEFTLYDGDGKIVSSGISSDYSGFLLQLPALS